MNTEKEYTKNTETNPETEDETSAEIIRILEEHPNLIPIAFRLIREFAEQKEQEAKAKIRRCKTSRHSERKDHARRD